jgi:hypothetical protein
MIVGAGVTMAQGFRAAARGDDDRSAEGKQQQGSQDRSRFSGLPLSRGKERISQSLEESGR